VHRTAGVDRRMSSASDVPTRVVVAENSYAIREFLVAMLVGCINVEIIAVCSDGRELRAALAAQSPDVLVTDIRMPPTRGEEGIRVARRLGVTDPEIGVVVLSQYAEPAYALALLESGAARAYLLTERIRDTGALLGAIEAVARGDASIDPEIVQALLEARARVARSPLPRLTIEERELLALIAEGRTTGAIAEWLALTRRTVEEQTSSIFSKLDLPDAGTGRARAALVFLAGEGT
jgi:DNA-binding NarL/FixJ family response regulator